MERYTKKQAEEMTKKKGFLSGHERIRKKKRREEKRKEEREEKQL